MRFPPARIIRDGAIDEEWETYIGANVRVPGPVLNDIRSMIAANNTAARKLGEIIGDYGIERHREYCEINKDLTEKLLRERIAAIPDGIYAPSTGTSSTATTGPTGCSSWSWSSRSTGSDLPLRLLRRAPDRRLRQLDPRAMFGQPMSGLMTLLVYGDLPVNGGLWRPITLRPRRARDDRQRGAARARSPTPTPRSVRGRARWPRTSSARRWR